MSSELIKLKKIVKSMKTLDKQHKLVYPSVNPSQVFIFTSANLCSCQCLQFARHTPAHLGKLWSVSTNTKWLDTARIVVSAQKKHRPALHSISNLGATWIHKTKRSNLDVWWLMGEMCCGSRWKYLLQRDTERCWEFHGGVWIQWEHLPPLLP